jgi:hypothetical protein
VFKNSQVVEFDPTAMVGFELFSWRATNELSVYLGLTALSPLTLADREIRSIRVWFERPQLFRLKLSKLRPSVRSAVMRVEDLTTFELMLDGDDYLKVVALSMSGMVFSSPLFD